MHGPTVSVSAPVNDELKDDAEQLSTLIRLLERTLIHRHPTVYSTSTTLKMVGEHTITPPRWKVWQKPRTVREWELTLTGLIPPQLHLVRDAVADIEAGDSDDD